ncbi:hypothetical protein CB0940_00496 [Cercospora beticola]|uniref:Uncharacterized protein n=1 Tax=Cercospora beticola TaxID=122368 RepID=A0A2G5I918_CERBT|nr:hypothetical protein CB0940_00496 [Cercospora beticola]PIB01307.1 hypothetical protein CB0940_00496 [Cercospora beticola]WPA95912.1 hypothetical protein RHO25_000516 [Cercospora beticola]
MSSSPPPQRNAPRRFAPEPVETTTRSSKQARKHSPDDQEPPKVRRFAPEPIETSTKSSRDKPASPSSDAKPAARRFAPQPIETTHKSSKDKSESRRSDSGSGVHIRFKPQLVETSYGSNRSSRNSSRRTSQHSDAGSGAATEHAKSRKFQPEVLSSAKRSRRKGDANDQIYQDYKTEDGFVIHAREHQRHAGKKVGNPEAFLEDESKLASSSRSREIPPHMRRPISPFDGSAPARPAVQPERTHSFRCPELDTIESSESEGDSGSSSRRSFSPGQGSPITASESSYPQEFYKHATRMRESVDESFSHYLLQLEQKKAQRRLQEAALAAFPNSDFHEPVHHYVNSEQDSSEEMEIEDRPVTWEGFDEEEFFNRAAMRRESTGRVPWEQLEMQRHAEQLEQERNANKTTEKKKENNNSPWWNPAAALSIHQQDSELTSMRDRARPPMLGRDLVFPRCPSPEPARFDVTQSCETLRKQMCYLNEQSNAESCKGGLWCAAPANKTEQKSSPSKSPSKSTAAKGLWGGFCINKEDTSSKALSPPAGPTGLMTPAPRADNGNPFEQSFAQRNGANMTLAPPTPPESVDLNRLDAMLMTQKELSAQIEREYPDSFVTQVYNYLSLGYPSLARPFDEELSKISCIPVSELREDDVKAKQSPRGYIRLGSDFEGGGGQGLTTQDCKRWLALRLYIHEWAKQEKNFDKTDAPGGNWATTQRRGSWAI